MSTVPTSNSLSVAHLNPASAYGGGAQVVGCNTRGPSPCGLFNAHFSMSRGFNFDLQISFHFFLSFFFLFFFFFGLFRKDIALILQCNQLITSISKLSNFPNTI